MTLKFAFSEVKAIEALAFIAHQRPGLTPLFVSKILFFAEKWHLNRYGRPIIGDTYIAMPRGPVPSTVKNFLDSNWQWADEPASLGEAIAVERGSGWPKLMPGARGPNLEVLSASDVECLEEAIAFCKDKTAAELSNITHFDKAWRSAEPNRPMDYAHFVDENHPDKDAILALAEESAAYGIL
jgi:hypothetical protein